MYSFIFTDLNARNQENIEWLYAISREGMTRAKTALSEIFEHNSMVNKYMIGQLILDESTLAHLRKLFKKISPDIKVTTESISALIEDEVLKRDILDPENTKDCRRVIKRKLSVPKVSAKADIEKSENE